jgi:peptidoglycan/LPS O-acetylase OafA/YrhL
MGPGTIVPLQALRAIAAISVAICHFDQIELILEGHGDDPLPLHRLASGVDLFFVISGFIMVHSSDRFFAAPGGSREFLARRIARIAPLYWLTTPVAVVVLSLPFDWNSAIKTALFIPYLNADGGIHPLNGVGWTLNFEMFFYALFAVSLLWPRRVAVPGLCAVLVLLAVLGRVFTPQWAPLQTWSDPIILEFAFGMGIALAFCRGVRLPPALRLCMIAIAAAALWLSSPVSGDRALLWGVPAATIVAAVVLSERTQERGELAKFAALLGDSSYSIYLIHPLTGGAILLGRTGVFHHTPTVPLLAIGLIVTVAISVIVFWFFERPATATVRRLLTARLRAPAASPEVAPPSQLSSA